MRAKLSYEFRIHQYVTDEEIEMMQPRWEEWQVERGANMGLHAGSASYSGYRPIVFVFETKEDAALFRLFFGGTLNSDLTPTLSKGNV